MFNKARRARTATATATAIARSTGALQVPVAPPLLSVVQKLGQRWQCSREIAAERIIVLALTGWKLQYADLIARLSRFVPGQDDPFRRTCLMLRGHFDTTEVELGEEVREGDRVAWMETMLEALEDQRSNGEAAQLASVLADGSRR